MIYFLMANSTIEEYNWTMPSNHVDDTISIEDIIYSYIGPVFIIIGLIGNSIAFLTLCRPPLNNFSSSVYLAAFSLSAVFVLVFCLGLDWCLHMTGTNHFKHSSDSACRLWEFLDKMIKCSGIWFLIGSAIDRFIGLWIPYKAQDMCTVFIAKVSVSLTLVGITSLNVHALWLQSYDEVYRCHLKDSVVVWQWISTILCNLLPQACIFIIGNLLVVRLCLKHRGRQIPETASIEMDLTYIVMIFSIVYGAFSLPSSITTIVISLNYGLMSDHKVRIFYEITNHMLWVCYSGFGLILAFRSKAFRESVIGMVFRCINLIRHGGSTVEMAIMTDDYDQVPSTSTTL